MTRPWGGEGWSECLCPPRLLFGDRVSMERRSKQVIRARSWPRRTGVSVRREIRGRSRAPQTLTLRGGHQQAKGKPSPGPQLPCVLVLAFVFQSCRKAERSEPLACGLSPQQPEPTKTIGARLCLPSCQQSLRLHVVPAPDQPALLGGGGTRVCTTPTPVFLQVPAPCLLPGKPWKGPSCCSWLCGLFCRGFLTRTCPGLWPQMLSPVPCALF